MSQLLHFLDVNIPMYAAGKDHPAKAACVYVMQEIAAGRLIVAIDTEIIQEILYRYGAIQHWDTATTLAENLLDLVPTVYPVDTTDIRKAIELFKKYAPQGVTARDVLHAAVMQNNGLTYIISMDEHFDRLEGLTRIAPQALYNQQAPRR
jgi:predicted nucleic acid-binding protein